MKAIVDFAQSLLASKRGHLAVFMIMYLLMAVEYYRFVYMYYGVSMGFSFLRTPVSILVGLLLFIALLFVIFGSCEDDTYTLSMIVGVLFCLPSIVMYQSGAATIFVALYSLLFVILLRTPILKVEKWPLPRIPSKYQPILLLIVTVLCLVPFPLAYGLNIDLTVFQMGERTYEIREAISSKQTMLTSYLLGPLRMVFLPLLIVMGLSNWKKSWWMALVGIAGLLFLFMLNPQKSIFFSIAVVLVFFLFKSYKAKAGFFLYLITAACLLSALLNIATGHLMAESIILRRLLFIPVLVSDNYFSFFDGHPLFLSHSFLSHWFDYPYETEPSRLIGFLMYNRTITNCNTGIIADGFMNFGHLGALFFVVIGAFFIRCVQGQLSDPRSFGLLALLVFTFLNSALFTTLLTHGGMMLLLAACFFQNNANDNVFPQK